MISIIVKPCNRNNQVSLVQPQQNQSPAQESALGYPSVIGRSLEYIACVPAPGITKSYHCQNKTRCWWPFAMDLQPCMIIKTWQRCCWWQPLFHAGNIAIKWVLKGASRRVGTPILGHSKEVPAMMTPVFGIFNSIGSLFYTPTQSDCPQFLHKKIGFSLSHLVPEIRGPKVDLIFHQNVLFNRF